MHSESVVSRLALGTVQFGLPYGVANRTGQVARPEAKAMLQLAAANGIDTLDTAIAYGESEACLGEVGTQAFKLVTKLPAVPDGCRDISVWVRQQVHASLSRLHASRLYGLLLHCPEQLLGKLGQALYYALGDLKSQGLVEKIGISIYAPDELESLCDGYTFDLVQTPFNVLDRRIVDTGWLARLYGQGVEVHVRSIFLQGLLLMPAAQRPTFFTRWQKLLETWDHWLVDHQLTPVQGCLRHILSFSEIAKVVVGADSKAQLQEIILCAEGTLPPLPSSLHVSDSDLLNPARWERR
ncbi:MAG: aldo/keto reductase [Nitrospira sp.]|nr:aldo/keto reductase [Nitrospira sp.]